MGLFSCFSGCLGHDKGHLDGPLVKATAPEKLAQDTTDESIIAVKPHLDSVAQPASGHLIAHVPGDHIGATKADSEALNDTGPVPTEAELRAILRAAKRQAAPSPQSQQGSAQGQGADARGSQPLQLVQEAAQALSVSTPGNEAWQRAATALAQACAALSANAATSTAETVAKALLEPECASLHNAFQPQSTQPLPAAAVAAGAELLQLQAELCQKAFNPRHHVRTLRTLVTKTFLTPSGPALPVLLRLLSASSTQLMTDMQQQGSGGDSSAAADAALIWDAASQIIRFVSAAVSQPDTAAATDQVTHLQSQLQKLTETGGPLWRVMAVSMSKRTARVQFAGYQVLRSLYELQSAGQAGTLDVAALYVTHHFHAFKRYYQAARGDPRSAAAELCRSQLRLLLAAVSTQSAAVRGRLRGAGAVGWLLSEVSIEAELLSLETAKADGSDGASQHSSTPHSPSHTHSDAYTASHLLTAGQHTDPHTDTHGANKDGGSDREDEEWLLQPFKLTGDLNEDLRRLEKYEKVTGKRVDLPGLEYDDEARALIERSDAQAKEHALISSPTPPSEPRARPALPPLRIALSTSARLSPMQPHSTRSAATAESPTAAGTPSGMPGTPLVPRLPLSNLRSAVSSRIATPAAASPVAAVPPASSRFSHAADSPVGAGSRAARTASALSNRMSDISMLSQRSYQLRSHASYGSPLPAAAAATHADTGYPCTSSVSYRGINSNTMTAQAAPLSSGRLHHSHLSPLSTRRSVDPSPRTNILTIPTQPSARGHHTTSESQCAQYGQDTSVHSRQSQGTSRLAAASYEGSQHGAQHGLHGAHGGVVHGASLAAQGGSGAVDASQGATQGDGLAAHGGADGGTIDGVGEQGNAYITQVTCGGFIAAAGEGILGAQSSDLLASEGGDAVPDLLPPRPSAPHQLSARGSAGARVPALNLQSLTQAPAARSGGRVSSHSLTLPTSAGTLADSAMHPSHRPPSPPSACRDSARVESQSGTSSYQAALQQKLWYHDMVLHASILRLLLQLLVSPAGALDLAYWQPFPVEVGLQNVEHLLTWHFAGRPGLAIPADLMQVLASAAAGAGQGVGVGGGVGAARHTALVSVVRLLRLLSRSAFEASRYRDLTFQTRGAYGAIYRAKATDPTTGATEQVVIKSIEIPGSIYNRCVLPDVYGEVSILERYAAHRSHPANAPLELTRALDAAASAAAAGDAAAAASGSNGICQLLDYGLTESAYWLVLRRYRCTLAEWRARQPRVQGPAAVALYLAVLVQITDSMLVLARDAVVHFDLKAANVLVEPFEGVKDGQLYGPPPPPPCEPYFRAVLADFGEARAYKSAEEAYTVRNRGTETYKSPEMLLIHSKAPSQAGITPTPHSAPSNTHNPQTTQTTTTCGAGLPSDVWSFGCLAYELIAGRPLFQEADYASVTHRVAFGGGAYLSLTDAEVAALGPEGPGKLRGLVEGILVRDPAKRPSLGVVREMLLGLREEMVSKASVKPSAA